MGKKSKKKPGAKKPSLQNPVSRSEVDRVLQHDCQQVLDQLRNDLRPLSSSRMTLTQIFRRLVSPEQRKAIARLPRQERKNEIRSIKDRLAIPEQQTVHSAEPDFRSSVCFGLKQTLRLIGQNRLKFLLYEPEVNVGPIKTLLDHGQIQMCGLTGLSRLVKDLLGFPASMIGIKQDHHHHFDALSELLSSIFPAARLPPVACSPKVRVPTTAKCSEATGPPSTSPNGTEDQHIELLKRSDRSRRVFQPDGGNKAKRKAGESEERGVDFLSFSASEAKRVCRYVATQLS